MVRHKQVPPNTLTVPPRLCPHPSCDPGSRHKTGSLWRQHIPPGHTADVTSGGGQAPFFTRHVMCALH